ncbi:MAG: hypothetical protein RMY34_24680 [Aulosira sp. DedQUE10]|nr:hypothetical protein [Aulosira sp. DedQUE10]
MTRYRFANANGSQLGGIAARVAALTAHATPVASPLALASPFGRRGDAQGTSRETRPTHWLNFPQNPKLFDPVMKYTPP